MKKYTRIAYAVALAVLASVLLAGTALAAWNFAFPIAVVDTSGTSRTYIPVLTGVTGSSMSSSGYMNATGTDTNMQIGSTDVPYMLSTTQIATVAPSLGAGSRINYNLYTGYSPVQTVFDIITGSGGKITISDAAALELGDDFEIEQKVYVDTSAGSSKDLVLKTDAFRTYVSAEGSITSGILSELIDVGATAADRDTSYSFGNTFVGLDNPANYTGTIDTIEIWATTDITGLRVGTFYLVSGTDYKCRDSEAIAGTITSGSKQTKSVSIDVVVGDYIGCYFTAGSIEMSTSGYAGVYYISGEYIDPDDQATYSELGSGRAMSLYGTGETPSVTVTATGVSSGEITVKTTADTTNLKIYIDDVEEDSTALSGVSVPDNSNDWLVMDNSTTQFIAYMEYYKHTVSDTEVVWYQPTGMITGTTLPDRDTGDGTQNGTITWGSNSNLTVTMGTVVSSESASASVSSEETLGFNVLESDMPEGWFGGGDITDLPFYDNFNEVSGSTGIPVRTIYVWSVYGVAIAVGFGTFVVFKPMLIGFLAALGVLWAGSSMGIVPGWVIFSFIILGVGIVYMRRQI